MDTRSDIVGRPNGCFASVVGLGIQKIFSTGFVTAVTVFHPTENRYILRFCTSSNLWTGEKDLLASTPAVFLSGRKAYITVSFPPKNRTWQYLVNERSLGDAVSLTLTWRTSGIYENLGKVANVSFPCLFLVG